MRNNRFETPTSEVSGSPEEIKAEASQLQRTELGVEDPETSTYAGYILGDAVLTKGIKLEDFYGSPEHMRFGNGTPQHEEAPKEIKSAFSMLTSESVNSIYIKMGIDPEAEDALKQALTKFTEAGITVTKAYAEDAEADMEYTTLAPNSTSEEVNAFIGFSQSVRPEDLVETV
jgi:hypothetical protein